MYFIDSSKPEARSQKRPSHVGKYVPLNRVCSRMDSTPPRAYMRERARNVPDLETLLLIEETANFKNLVEMLKFKC